MIKIIDYGIGNIQAFLNVYKRLGINSGIAHS
nr:imidazole glycerol phosphate synthase subunit HisH [Escherichia coli]